MKKKRNILKKVLLICCMVGLLFTLTCYENYSEVAAASKASYKIVNKRQVKRYKDHKAEYLYQLPQLKGKSAAIQAFQNTKPDICLLVSPVLDMEDMISNMMLQAQVTEEQLKERQEIKTETGVVLSWKYLCWVREYPVKSICKETNILYGTQDEMIPYKIVKKFSEENNCRLNFVENGQHWLHTDREVAAMRKWEQTVLEESRSIIPNK